MPSSHPTYWLFLKPSAVFLKGIVASLSVALLGVLITPGLLSAQTPIPPKTPPNDSGKPVAPIAAPGDKGDKTGTPSAPKPSVPSDSVPSAKDKDAATSAPTPSAAPSTKVAKKFKALRPRDKVTFNLENADLQELVKLIADITGKRFIIPGKTRDIQATVYAPSEVTAAAAYQAFLSILEINGMTVVPSGRYLKLVESENIESRPIPLYTGGKVPSYDSYVTHMHQVGNISSNDATELLSRFKSPEGNITAYGPTNMIIMTDTGSNIRRMLRILKKVDVPRTGEQLWIEPVHHANATELAETIQKIFPTEDDKDNSRPNRDDARQRRRTRRLRNDSPSSEPSSSSGGAVGEPGLDAGLTNIFADERTNSLVIMASERAYLRVLELIRRFDIPLEGEGRIRVHFLQNGDAQDIAGTLQSLVGSSGSTGAASRRPRPGAAPSAQSSSAALFEGEVQVTAHEASNALVIVSSLHDYAALRRVIDKLDAPRRQVFIEAVIMELSISRTNTLGLSFHGGIGDQPVDGALSILGFNAQGSLSPLNQDTLTGLAAGVTGPTIAESQQLLGVSIPAFGVVLNALANTGDANILSTPHIIALDNTEAEISVGENIPLQTSGIPAGALGGLGGLLGGVNNQQGNNNLGALAGAAGGFAGAVPRQDIGTTIRLTPHINDDNSIRLEIEEEISDRGATEGSLGVVSINRREASTEVVVKDQQTVVIGGLMRDTVTTGESKVPILGDIPLLGVLFRRTTKSKQKNNLLLFLTPYVIRDTSDLRAIFERKMRERQDFIDRYFVFGDSEYTPPTDYSRTRGLVTEISNQLQVVSEERRLTEAARSRPEPKHVPRSPVGVATDTDTIVEGQDPDATAPEPLPDKDKKDTSDTATPEASPKATPGSTKDGANKVDEARP